MDCPTPTKKKFRSAAEAKRYNRSSQWPGGKARLWPYECDCGSFHLTTQNYDEQKRIAESIAKYLGKK